MNETHYTVYYRYIYTYTTYVYMYVRMYACMYLYVYMYICMCYTKSAFQLTNVGHNKAHPNYLQATRVSLQ